MRSQLPFFRSIWFRVSLVLCLIILLSQLIIFGLEGIRLVQDDRARASNQLRATVDGAGAIVENWLSTSAITARTLAGLPDLASLAADRQTSTLAAIAKNNPVYAAASVVDANGAVLAQSNGTCAAELEGCKELLNAQGQRQQPVTINYAQEAWFSAALRDQALFVMVDGQILQGELISNSPVLLITSLIPANLVEGANGSNQAAAHPRLLVLFIRSSELAQQFTFSQAGASLQTLVVDQNDRPVVSTGPVPSGEASLSTFPPVVAGRGSKTTNFVSEFNFTDSTNNTWRTANKLLANHWLVVVEQPQEIILATLRTEQIYTYTLLAISLVILFLLVSFIIYRSLRPIQAISDVANSVSAGNFDRLAPAPSNPERADEFGRLAESFNRMVLQLRELFRTLETRVLERTQVLERRSSQLEAAAIVARRAARIRDLNQLLTETTQLISERFNFYHAGIFILDIEGKYAVLQAANSEGGQRMLARNHKLLVGQVGIVGFVASSGTPRIALDVGLDAVFFNNPDLPRTRSELALPLSVAAGAGMAGQIIGVLDVQSEQPNAFSQEDIAVLQIVADQIALAIENARLFEQSKAAYEELNRLYSDRTQQSWLERLEGRTIGYRYNTITVEPVNQPGSQPVQPQDENPWVLKVPIVLRSLSDQAGRQVGSIVLRRSEQDAPWSKEEEVLVGDALAQVVPALENARLLEEIQQTARMESLVGQISTRMTESLDLEHVMNKAVTEIGAALKVNRVRIQLETTPESLKSPQPEGEDAHNGNHNQGSGGPKRNGHNGGSGS